MHQINHNQDELDQLQRLQSLQDQSITDLASILGPLSPSGHIPAFEQQVAEFNPSSLDFDTLFDFNGGVVSDAAFGQDGDDFPTDFDTNDADGGPYTAATVLGLDTVQDLGGMQHQGEDGPSPALTEEIARDEYGGGVRVGADHGSKRRRVI